MFTLERQQNIDKLVKQKNSIKVSELSQIFGVSESTIRRDLQEMEERGLLMRTHGGAIDSAGMNFEPTFNEKKDDRHEDKVIIGKIAAELIKPKDTILLDSGTTTYEIAKSLEVKNITVITNSIDNAEILSQKEGIELILTGGILRYNTRAMVGNVAEETIKKFRVDKAFIGTNGINIKDGLTTPNILEAQIKNTMISIAKKTILVTDSSKFNKVCFSVISLINNISTVITAGEISKNLIDDYNRNGVEIVVG